MKIPKKVIICGQTFDVVYMKELSEDGQKLLGKIDTSDNKIYLKNGMAKDREAEVFLHECIHGLDENLDIGLGEKRVGILGVTIYSFLKTNNFIKDDKRKK